MSNPMSPPFGGPPPIPVPQSQSRLPVPQSQPRLPAAYPQDAQGPSDSTVAMPFAPHGQYPQQPYGSHAPPQQSFVPQQPYGSHAPQPPPFGPPPSGHFGPQPGHFGQPPPSGPFGQPPPSAPFHQQQPAPYGQSVGPGMHGQHMHAPMGGPMPGMAHAPAMGPGMGPGHGPGPGPGGPPGMPSVHIRAFVTWLTIFPLAAVGLNLLSRFASGMHPLLRVFILVTLIVPAAVYFIVPKLLGLFMKIKKKLR